MSLVSDRASTVKILNNITLERHTFIDVAENLGILLLKLDRISLYPQSIAKIIVSTLAVNFGLQPTPSTQDSCYIGLLFETVCDSDYPEERGSGRVR